MKPLLMHCDRDFEPPQRPPAECQAHAQDLQLDVLLRAMAADDDFVLDIVKKAFFAYRENDTRTVHFRQEALKDCLNNESVIREFYGVATRAMTSRKKPYFTRLWRSPYSLLYEASEGLQMLVGMLRTLRAIAEAHSGHFVSEAFARFVGTLQAELGDEYLLRIESHLTDLKFRDGLLVSAELGAGNEGTNYVLRQAAPKGRRWLERLIARQPPGYTFYIAERDEAGAQALSELEQRALNSIANALAQSADHIVGFFDALRTELAFYIGCVTLHRALLALGGAVTFPRPEPAGTGELRCSGLYDPCLAFRMGRAPVGNALDTQGRTLVVITGANQGGKSSFLRAIGLAQWMMQSGMFVAAESFAGDLCSALFTHFKREEDATMTSGKLAEELGRMSDIANLLAPDAVVLFNESFASTNEREGSEIARQVVCALVERRIRVFFVTHLYEFAHGLLESRSKESVFLRAERRPGGTRTFQLIVGEPLETSYGEDLYREIFTAPGESAGP